MQSYCTPPSPHEKHNKKRTLYQGETIFCPTQVKIWNITKSQHQNYKTLVNQISTYVFLKVIYNPLKTLCYLFEKLEDTHTLGCPGSLDKATK